MLYKYFLLLNDVVSKVHIQFCGLLELFFPLTLHAEISLYHQSLEEVMRTRVMLAVPQNLGEFSNFKAFCLHGI